MKPHSARYAPTKAAVICRAALSVGPLEYHQNRQLTGWKFGRRIFSKTTVALLIEAGEAIRDGEFVRAA